MPPDNQSPTVSPPCVLDWTIGVFGGVLAYASDCHDASTFQTPGTRPTRGAANPTSTPGRWLHQRHPADQTSPCPVAPGIATSTSRVASVRAAVPAHSTGPRGTADNSTTTTSTVAKPSDSGLTARRVSA